jgi:hypothetical protein
MRDSLIFPLVKWPTYPLLLPPSLLPPFLFHPLRRLMPSSINLKLGTFSFSHVRVASDSACAMLCDHFGPTPAMRPCLRNCTPHAPHETTRVGSDTICNVLPIRGRACLCLGNSLRPQEYPHIPTHVFSAHFFLTHAHSGRTSRSVSHCSRPSTLNIGVLLRWASGKEVATCL